jgi:hypothetical protein
MYRRWNWADKIFGHHGDEMVRMDRHFEATGQVEESHWWWMRRRWEQEMAEIMAKMEAPL